MDAGRWQISSGGGQMMRVPIEVGPEFRPGSAEVVFEAGLYPVNPLARSFDISPDGQRFLMMKDAGADAVAPL